MSENLKRLRAEYEKAVEEYEAVEQEERHCYKRWRKLSDEKYEKKKFCKEIARRVAVEETNNIDAAEARLDRLPVEITDMICGKLDRKSLYNLSHTSVLLHTKVNYKKRFEAMLKMPQRLPEQFDGVEADDVLSAVQRLQLHASELANQSPWISEKIPQRTKDHFKKLIDKKFKSYKLDYIIFEGKLYCVCNRSMKISKAVFADIDKGIIHKPASAVIGGYGETIVVSSGRTNDGEITICCRVETETKVFKIKAPEFHDKVKRVFISKVDPTEIFLKLQVNKKITDVVCISVENECIRYTSNWVYITNLDHAFHSFIEKQFYDNKTSTG